MGVPFYKKVLVPGCISLHNTFFTVGKYRKIYAEDAFKEKIKRAKFSKLTSKDILRKYKIEKHDDTYCKIKLGDLQSEILDEVYDTPIFDATEFGGNIAGGFCSRVLFDAPLEIKIPHKVVDEMWWTPYPLETLLTGDIDVFFTDEKNAKQYIQYLNNYASLCEVDEHGYGGSWGTNYSGKIHKNENQSFKVQVIARTERDDGNQIKDVRGFMDVFDLSASKMFIEGEYLYIHKLAFAGLLKNKLIATDFHSVNSFARRVAKYMALYGYNETDISDIPKLLDEPNNLTFLKLQMKNMINPLNEVLSEIIRKDRYEETVGVIDWIGGGG